MAGTVKGRKAARHATSDWMELEKQRGISVTSSVMQFPYGKAIVNLLDTPGHEDFSEDTYRTLTAVDSALMVIDVAKGVEERTIKLMDVCRLRDTPILTFVNKLDREGRDAIEIMDEVEDIQNPAANDDIVDEDVETITIVPPAAAYGSADMNDDNVVDAIVIDTNHDGKADLLAMDENFDGVYESFQINEDGDKDLDVFIIDHGGDGIDDGDEITEIADVVDMEDFIILDSDDEVLEGLDFIDELIDVEEEEEDSEMDDTTDDLGFDDPGL